MEPRSIFDDLAEDEQFMEEFVRHALRNADGLTADKREARVIARRFGLDGDDTNSINERLDNGTR